MRFALLVALALLATPGSAHAASGSLSYVKDGDVYVAAPDGSRAARVTTDGGYAWPSQADDGTLVAVRERRLHRFARSGALLGAPIETMPDNSDFIGPLAPQVSPDGAVVAYHFFNTGVLSDRTRPSVAYTRSDVGTEPGVFGGALGGYLTPSWTADGRVLVFYGAQRTSHVGIDTPGGGYVDWFGDPAVETLLTNGELTRAGDKLVAIGDQNDLRFYDAGSAALGCVMTGFNGAVSDPTWSPEGDALAWEEADGIHVAARGECGAAARSLVVPGGRDPDWGPAAAPAVSAPPAPSGGGGAASAPLRIDVSGWRGSVKARRTLTVRARCSARCALTATLTTRKFGRIAKARGTGTLTLRLRADVVRRIVRARRMDATLTVSSGNVRVVRSVRLTR